MPSLRSRAFCYYEKRIIRICRTVDPPTIKCFYAIAHRFFFTETLRKTVQKLIYRESHHVKMYDCTLQVREYSVWLTRQIDPLTLLTFYLADSADLSADFANILPS